MVLALHDTYEAVSLLPSTTATNGTAGAGDAVYLPHMARSFTFTMDLTAAATGGLDTLSVYVQTKLDGPNGDQWVDVVAFAGMTGDGGTKVHIEKVSAAPAFAGFEIGTTLTAGTVRDLIGDVWRVRYAPAGTGSFTFRVTAQPG